MDTIREALPELPVELTDDQCDRLVALTMDRLAAKHSDQYGTTHALDLNPNITEHHTLRRSIVRAAHMHGALAASPAAPAAQAEPVAWMWQHEETGRVGIVDIGQLENGWQADNPRHRLVSPLYPAPPPAEQAAQAEPREPLTEAQIDDIKASLTWWNGSHDMTNHYDFARAIERAHGIGRG